MVAENRLFKKTRNRINLIKNSNLRFKVVLIEDAIVLYILLKKLSFVGFRSNRANQVPVPRASATPGGCIYRRSAVLLSFGPTCACRWQWGRKEILAAYHSPSVAPPTNLIGSLYDAARCREYCIIMVPLIKILMPKAKDFKMLHRTCVDHQR